MTGIRVLLVDDDEVVRLALSCVLEQCGFQVTGAANVSEALKHISGPVSYDVLLSDLHMPGAGDGLTVVSAMKHANPQSVAMLISAFPEMNAATQAILLQADEILVKPLDLGWIGGAIQRMVLNGPVRSPRARDVESVAAVLGRTTQSILRDWFERMQANEDLKAIPMSYELRCGHLASMLRDVVTRLRTDKSASVAGLTRTAAMQHGAERRKQGYTAAMLVEEFRLLQASVFSTLQNNLARIDFNLLLAGMTTIADEIAVQLAEAAASFTDESPRAAGMPMENDSARINAYLNA
jgi:CheY-like chemotaxis protein